MRLPTSVNETEVRLRRVEIAALAPEGPYCKLSGLRTEQRPDQFADELAPYVEHLVSCFGRRLMWRSDWPVVTRFGGTYGSWLAEAARLTGLSGEPGQRLFAGCAREFYGLLSSSPHEETLLWDSFSPAQSL